MRDRLIDILKTADAAKPRCDEVNDAALFELASRDADRRLRRRNVVGGVVASFTLSMLVFGLQYLSPRPSKQLPSDDGPFSATMSVVDPAIDPAVDDAALRADIERLKQESAVASAFIEQYESRRRMRKLTERMNRRAPITVIVHERIAAESAAQTMLIRADRLAGDALTQRLAPETYRRVIELFPDSAAALDARRRLESGPKGERA